MEDGVGRGGRVVLGVSIESGGRGCIHVAVVVG